MHRYADPATWMAVAAVAALLVAAGPVALAQSDDVVTRHRTYETAVTNQVFGIIWTCPTGFVLGAAGQDPDCDPAGQTQDGSFDLGGAIFRPDPTTADATGVRVRIVDDAWGGGAVAGFVCITYDDNHICPEEDGWPLNEVFCGASSTLPLEPGGGWSILVFVHGSSGQALYCDPADAPTGGTSGGVLTEEGGVYADFTVPG